MPPKRSAALEAAQLHWAKKFKLDSGSSLINDDTTEDQIKIPESTTKIDSSATTQKTEKKDPQVIIISSDDDSETEFASRQTEQAQAQAQPAHAAPQNDYGVHVLYNPSYDDPEKSRIANAGAITIESLVGDKDLMELFQFNFSIEYDFFMSYFDPSFSRNKRPITFITTSAMTDEERIFMNKHFNFKMIVPRNIPRFGSHHTKLMINFFEDNTCQIVIMTCNLAKIDFGALTQMLWKSKRLPLGTTTSKQGAQFQIDFVNYLRRYGEPVLEKLVSRLLQFNFLSINVELLASAPGTYEMSNGEENYGIGKLYHLLKRNRLLLPKPLSPSKQTTTTTTTETKITKITNILAQISSIAYPYKTENNQPYNIFTHLLCPLMFEGDLRNVAVAAGSVGARAHQKSHHYRPHIIFPTIDDVARNNMGYGAGRAVHFNYTLSCINRNHYRLLKPYMCKWNTIAAKGAISQSPSVGNSTEDTKRGSIPAGREQVVPHVKIFLSDNGDDWHTLRWFLLTSHNLSKQGWGSPVKPKGGKTATSASKNSTYSTNLGFNNFTIASYELGVFIPGPLQYHTLANTSPSSGSSTHLKEETYCTPNGSVCIPFNLPPTPYLPSDLPWSPQVDSTVPDKFGQVFTLSNAHA